MSRLSIITPKTERGSLLNHPTSPPPLPPTTQLAEGLNCTEPCFIHTHSDLPIHLPKQPQNHSHSPVERQGVLTLARIIDGDTLLLGKLAEVRHLTTEVHGGQTAPETSTREHAILDVVSLQQLFGSTTCNQHIQYAKNTMVAFPHMQEFGGKV